jgi:putative acetyltransferase
MDISIESPDQPDVLALLEASDAYMALLYPAESNHLLDVGALQKPEVTFVVARVDGRAAGCGAVVRPAAGWAEIKRMFVAEGARGQRIGQKLLQRLECVAAVAGCQILRLETGVKQTEAIGLYRSAGFAEIPAFGDYKSDPLSVFMEKSITAESRC